MREQSASYNTAFVLTGRMLLWESKVQRLLGGAVLRITEHVLGYIAEKSWMVLDRACFQQTIRHDELRNLS
jgi:hypothetical protein